ncbi:polysaccharide deacetylase, partial [Streptomyces apricus]
MLTTAGAVALAACGAPDAPRAATVPAPAVTAPSRPP